jgi:hypothetical protein
MMIFNAFLSSIAALLLPVLFAALALVKNDDPALDFDFSGLRFTMADIVADLERADYICR